MTPGLFNAGDATIPWISIDSPKTELLRLKGADEIVLPYRKVTLVIDYPLTTVARFELSTTADGFTRRQLVLAISEKYHQLYKEEEASATIKTQPMEKRSIMNRNETNGKYGICCHDLSDLDLGSIDVSKDASGTIFLSLGVES